MSADTAFVEATDRLRFTGVRVRSDSISGWATPQVKKAFARLLVTGLGLFFVILGATNLDLGPSEARLGLAAGERLGPLGQVFGYWAPDVWPAQVVPSYLLGRLEPFHRPTPAAVRWPAALAGVIAGWIIARSMARVLGLRAGVLVAACWFGSVALIDRSSMTGLDLIAGLATLAAIDRLMTRGSDRFAGFWAALAFLAAGWPPLLVIALAVIVIGKRDVGFSSGLVLPPLATAILWSFWAIRASSAEIWAASLTLPLTQKPAWTLGAQVFALGLPWSPFAILLLSRSIRQGWNPDGRYWVTGWLKLSLAALVVGTLVPGVGQVARVVVLTGLLIGTAACLGAAWTRVLGRNSRRAFFCGLAALLALWLIVMIYHGYVLILAMPFYRPLGIALGILTIGVAFLGWSALLNSNSRRGVVALMAIAVALKLVHWGYYVPELNYRDSQGPWGRAIGQWVPKRWSLYTFHEWPADLAFFVKRPVRQLRSPQYLEYQPGPRSKFVLLQASEFENWPQTAPPITIVTKLLDQWGDERVLARTAGAVPPPLGPNPTARQSVARTNKVISEISHLRR
jgi:hypothetical protein